MNGTVGSKIKALRLQKKISQNELCGDFINRSILSRIENNKMTPSVLQLKYMADKLGVPVSYFLTNFNYSEAIKETVTEAAAHVDSDIYKLFKEESYYEIIKFYEYNESGFKQIGDFKKYYYLGMSFFNQDMPAEGLRPLKKFVNEYTSLTEAGQKRHIIDFAIALNTLFKIMLKNACYTKGKHYLNMAAKYLSSHGETNALIYFIVINNLAYIYNQTGQYQKTITIIESLFNIQNNLSYRMIMPDLHKALNVAYNNMGDYDKAIRHIKKCMLLFSYEENETEYARCFINYINDLRFANRFSEAFQVVEDCKSKYSGIKELYPKFLIQELILYFNIGDYEKVLLLSKQMNYNDLPIMSRNNYNFMLGHIAFLKKDYEKARKHLEKCEKYFVEKGYAYDLSVLYEHLYDVTQKPQYFEKMMVNRGTLGRKNIYIY